MIWTDYSSAPEAGTEVCPRGAVRGVLSMAVESGKGSFPLLLVETAGGLRAYVNACPHQYLPLDHRGGRILSADGTKLMCTNHAAHFDAVTGEGVAGEGLGCRLDAVPVYEAGGVVRIGAA